MGDDPPRKRLKRTTKSCYPCRKRKVKCSLTEKSTGTCAECVRNGSHCTPDAPSASSNGDSPPTRSTAGEDHGSRLDRIECLLKKLVEAQDGAQPAVTQPGLQPALTDLWDDALLSVTNLGTSSTSNSNFDELGSFDFATALPTVQTPTRSGSAIQSLPHETADARQSLVSLLPSPQDAVTVVMNTLAWLWGAETPSGSVLRPDDTIQILDLETISDGSAVQVSKTLLLFALYMQQLPSGFDESQLGFESLDQAVFSIVDRVKAYIMTHDEEASTLDGLECLLLLSTIYLNTGDIRKTWVSFRKTVDMARLSGVHRSFSVSQRDSTSDEDALRRRLWLSAVCGDCYCSLLLGQEPSLGAQPFGPGHRDWNDPVAEKEANIERSLCTIMARIAERNAFDQFHDEQLSFKLSHDLDKMYESLPLAWWDTPLFAPDRPLDTAQEPNRLLCQVWYFLARTFAALPIAFGPPSQRSQDRLQDCISASRSVLSRHVGLRHVREQLSRCRGGEQAAFLSAAVLLLAVFELRLGGSWKLGTPVQLEPTLKFELDRDLIQQTITSFEARGKGGCRERASKQCFEILSAMRDCVFSRDPFASPVKRLSRTDGSQKSEMESLVDTAIWPSLDTTGPAARLLELTFARETV